MPDQSPLESSAIQSLRSLSPNADNSFLRELIEIYLQDTPARLIEMETALGKGDAPTLMRAAHSIKGSSGNFGATRLAQLAQEIETLGKAGTCLPALPLLPGIKAEYAAVARALQQIARDP